MPRMPRIDAGLLLGHTEPLTTGPGGEECCFRERRIRVHPRHPRHASSLVLGDHAPFAPSRDAAGKATVHAVALSNGGRRIPRPS